MNGTDWGTLTVNLAACAATAAAVLLATFAVAVRRGLHRIVDIAWGLAFSAVAAVTWLLSADRGDDGRLLVAAATIVWGLRLAGHIARRSRGHGEDPRYTALLDKAPGNRTLHALRTVYLGQAALVRLISLPVQTASYSSAPLGTWPSAGSRWGRSGSPSRPSAAANWRGSGKTRSAAAGSWSRACEPGHVTPTTSVTASCGGACTCSPAPHGSRPWPSSSPLS